MRCSNRSLGRSASLLPLLFLLLTGLSLHAASPTPLPPPAPAGSLFQERAIGAIPRPETPLPKRHNPEDEKPIPREWIIGGIAAAVLVIAGILFRSARAWRSSNIFDQQYRFPVNDNPALRFGAHRCGGHMATIRLDGNADRKRVTASKAENA